MTETTLCFRRSWLAGLAAAVAVTTVAGVAAANCRSLEVLDAISVCRGVNGCPPGEYLYSVVLRNKSKKRLYIAYRFRDPRGILTRGGLDIAPSSDIERPIGFGRKPFNEAWSGKKRRDRFSAAKCGFNERTKFTWKK